MQYSICVFWRRFHFKRIFSIKGSCGKTGKEIKTGSINTLKVKGLVETKENAIEYKAEIVETRTYADGTVIVIKKEKQDSETGYKLV